MTASLTRDLTNYDNFTYKEAMAIFFKLDATSYASFPYNGVTTIFLTRYFTKKLEIEKKELLCILINIC